MLNKLQMPRKMIELKFTFLMAILTIIVCILSSGSPGKPVNGAESTALIITGEACMLAAEAIRDAVEANLDAIELATLLTNLERICRGLRDISPEMILFRLAQPQLRLLLELVANGVLDTPEGLQRVLRLARRITATIG